jgi:hypothetical protein
LGFIIIWGAITFTFSASKEIIEDRIFQEPQPSLHAIPCFQSGSRLSRVAIVMPFTQTRFHHVLKSMHLWKSVNSTSHRTISRLKAGMVPCDLDWLPFGDDGKNHTISNFTLVWYVDGPVLQQSVHKLLIEGFSQLQHHKQCFQGGWQVVNGDILANTSSLCTSCMQFYRAFTLLDKQYDYFFWYGLNVYPVQPYWLHAISEESRVSSPSHDFWMKGSVMRCNKLYRGGDGLSDGMINANALYKLGDEDFRQYREKVQQYYFSRFHGCIGGCSTGAVYGSGFDNSMHAFRHTASAKLLCHQYHVLN